jgi:sialic acid synthase
MSIHTNPVIIAEIGCNHKGDLEIAHEMIKIASVFCHVDIVKFQKRTNKELLSPEEYNTPHPNPSASYGKTYGEHREFLEFNKAQHARLKEWCEAEGVIYSTSVWDLTAAKDIVPLKPVLLKIPSASNLDFELLRYVLDNHQGEIHVSLGMTTHAEEESIVRLFEEKKRNICLHLWISGALRGYLSARSIEAEKQVRRSGQRHRVFRASSRHCRGRSGRHPGREICRKAFHVG